MAKPSIEKLVARLNQRPQPREFSRGDAEKLVIYYRFTETEGKGSHTKWQRGRHYVSFTKPRTLTDKEVQMLRDAINAVRQEIGDGPGA